MEIRTTFFRIPMQDFDRSAAVIGNRYDTRLVIGAAPIIKSLRAPGGVEFQINRIRRYPSDVDGG